MHQLNLILQVASVTLVLYACVMLCSHLRQAMHLWAGIGFTICVSCYLAIEAPFIIGNPYVRGIFLTGSISVPVFFWLLSRSIFDDHFEFEPVMVGWFLLQIVPHFPHYINCSSWLPAQVANLFNVLSQLVSLGFVFTGMYVALKTKTVDLIESRLRFRNTFVVVTAVLIGMTVIVESTPLIRESKDLLQVLQRSSILILTGYFLFSNFQFQAGFFFREFPKAKPMTPPEDTELETALMKLLNDQKIYR